MGIFGIYMPPIYGEGEHAFIRLQEEILKVSNDHTIFAWKTKLPSIGGILATSPDVFEESGGYMHLSLWSNPKQQPFSMTNMGLLVHLPLLPILPVIDDKPQFLALLNCESIWSRHLAILVKTSIINENQYERIQTDKLLEDLEIWAKCGEIEQSPQELLFEAWASQDLSSFRSHNHFNSNQIAVFYSGGQGIEPIMANPFNADLPVTANTTDPAEHRMGVFTLDHDHFPQTFLFRDDQTCQQFVVVAGISISGIWLDLVILGSEILSLDEIRQPYSNGKVQRKNLDRMLKLLTDTVVVLIEARRQYQSGLNDTCYVLNVRIVDNSYPQVAPAILPGIGTSYAFHVSFSGAINAGFSLLDISIPRQCLGETEQ
ncbi:hypothetical protein BDP27DRAFT_1498202 [Rhodocollybia butyracea]|uniref:DUF8212 domain-containing protein n=1 Tax=Rhodocollybia butyracea TaxID=206335 RepID=A0A9P5TYR3_9AGAR|nr:hypothetical protein BDP27DRAFT_1498202 [Rhodocollybia butyracea]